MFFKNIDEMIKLCN